jgi:hypothetical protein
VLCQCYSTFRPAIRNSYSDYPRLTDKVKFRGVESISLSLRSFSATGQVCIRQSGSIVPALSSCWGVPGKQASRTPLCRVSQDSDSQEWPCPVLPAHHPDLALLSSSREPGCSSQVTTNVSVFNMALIREGHSR